MSKVQNEFACELIYELDSMESSLEYVANRGLIRRVQSVLNL
jgi:hypothetical protein